MTYLVLLKDNTFTYVYELMEQNIHDPAQLVSPAEAARYYGVTPFTLRRWADDGTIRAHTTPGGHRRYYLQPKLPDPTPDTHPDAFVIYARVSSAKQRGDLERQVKSLQRRFPTYRVVRDIGSGINFERPGFKTLLEQLFEGKIRKVVVAYPDRFSRFGFDFFVWLFKQFGAHLVGLSRSNLSREEELAADLMEIVTVFAARYHGLRKYDHGGKEGADLP